MLAVLSLASVVWCVGTTSAWTAAVASTDAQASSGVPQWEYLVVTGGKTYFSPTLERSAEGESKAILAGASTFTSEAVAAETQMDALGHRGWELVAIVGAIGGDQELVFKRPYVKALVEAEAAERRAQAEKWAALLKGAEKPTPGGTGTEIVDLDERDRLERLAKNMERLQAQVDTALKLFLVPGVKIEKDTLVTPRWPMVGDEAVLGGTLVIDATNQLLSADNTYRSSAATALAKQIYRDIFRTMPESVLVAGVGVELTIRGKTVASWDIRSELLRP